CAVGGAGAGRARGTRTGGVARTADEAAPQDEQCAAWRAAYEQALAAGGTPTGAAPPPELRPRLERDAAFLHLLGAVWPRHPPPGPPAAGLPAELGRFRIIRELGRGGGGVVVLAHARRLGGAVALKVPRAEVLLDADGRARFLREARAVAGLDHPNLVPVYEAGEAGAVCWIASAYCPGPTLAAWLRAQVEPVPARQA